MSKRKTLQSPSQTKLSRGFVLSSDEAQGIVEAIVSVFGVVDYGNDRIWPGAYVKTIVERIGRIRVFDSHNGQRISDVLGKPLSMREVGREELPDSIKSEYPEATGGLLTVTQYNMQRESGRDAFYAITSGDVTEYSIGWDPLDSYMSEEDDPERPGKKRRVRNIKQIRLWEYSPVAGWGMNPATSTVAVKTGSQVEDGMDHKSSSSPPNLRAAEAGGSDMCSSCWFYQGNRLCSRHGTLTNTTDVCDEFESAASYNYQPEMASSLEKEMIGDEPVTRLGDAIHATILTSAVNCLSSYYSSGYLSSDEMSLILSSVTGHLNDIRQMMPDDVALRSLANRYLLWSSGTEPQTKAGRVLSDANARQIRSAVEALMKVLESAGVYNDEDDKQLTTPTALPEPEPSAGPTQLSPTDQSKARLLERILLIPQGD